MMTKINFDGFYKGGRDYVHGTDIYNNAQTAANEKFGPESYVKSLVIRSVARSKGAFFFGCREIPDGYQEKAQFKIRNGQEDIKGFFATNGNIVTEKKDYEENLVMQNAKINKDENAIVQIDRTGFTSIEEVVALTKFLHNSILLPEHGQWMFTMLDLKEPLIQKRNILYSVRLKQNLGGKMTRSELFANDRSIGTIGFTVL